MLLFSRTSNSRQRVATCYAFLVYEHVFYNLLVRYVSYVETISICKLCYLQILLADTSESTAIIIDIKHFIDVIMSAIGSQFTRISIVYSTVCSGADQRKHQSSASRAFVRGIYLWPVNFPHKGQLTRNLFPFDDVIMIIWTFSHFLRPGYEKNG